MVCNLSTDYITSSDHREPRRCKSSLSPIGDSYRVSLREWPENSAVPSMCGFRQDFPALAQHLGDVVIHLLEIKQSAFVVRTEHIFLVREGLYLHGRPPLPQYSSR